MSGEADRVPVTTYVPRDQRQIWKKDAESLEMSQSEFVRSMVQAGRRSFTLEVASSNPEEAPPSRANPRSDDLKTMILDLFRRKEALKWTDLVDELEDELDRSIEELLEENRIEHHRRSESYSLRKEAADGN